MKSSVAGFKGHLIRHLFFPHKCYVPLIKSGVFLYSDKKKQLILSTNHDIGILHNLIEFVN